MQTISDRDKYKTCIQPHLCDLREVLEPEELAVKLFERKCITLSQKEEISRHEDRHGKQRAASHILIDLFPRTEGWFDLLMEWLMTRQHQNLVTSIRSKQKQLEGTSSNRLHQPYLPRAEGDSMFSSSESCLSDQSTLYNVVEVESSVSEFSQCENDHRLNDLSNGNSGRSRVHAENVTEIDLEFSNVCSVKPLQKMASGVEEGRTSNETCPKTVCSGPDTSSALTQTVSGTANTVSSQGNTAANADASGQSSSTSSSVPAGFYIPRMEQTRYQHLAVPILTIQGGDQPSMDTASPLVIVPGHTPQTISMPSYSQLLPSQLSSSSGGNVIHQDAPSHHEFRQQDDSTSINSNEDHVGNKKEECIEGNSSVMSIIGIGVVLVGIGFAVQRYLK